MKADQLIIFEDLLFHSNFCTKPYQTINAKGRLFSIADHLPSL